MIAHQKMDARRVFQFRCEDPLETFAGCRPSVDGVAEEDEDVAWTSDVRHDALDGVEIPVDVSDEDRARVAFEADEPARRVQRSRNVSGNLEKRHDARLSRCPVRRQPDLGH